MSWRAVKLALVPLVALFSGWGIVGPVTATAATAQCSTFPQLVDSQPSFDEGDHTVLTLATFSDQCANVDTTYTSTITWSTTGDAVGGATSSSGTVVVDSFDPQTGTAQGHINGTPPYLESGDAHGYSVSLTRDSGTNPTESMTPSTQFVNDPDICGAVGTPVSTTEGLHFTGPVGAFEDLAHNPTADDYAVVIDWGDGTPTSAGTVSPASDLSLTCDDLAFVLSAQGAPRFVAQAPTQWVVNGSHTYAHDGTYNVTFDVVDSGNDNTGTTPTDIIDSDGTNPAQAQVADAALAGTCATGLSGTAGVAFSGKVAAFTDADPGGIPVDYTATINWGDGTAVAPATISGAGPGGEVRGSHTYAAAGTYTLTIKVMDAGGSTVTVTCDPASGGAFGVLGVPKLPQAGHATVTPGAANGLAMYALAILALVFVAGGGVLLRARRD